MQPVAWAMGTVKSQSERTRFRQSRQSRPEHPGVSDGN